MRRHWLVAAAISASLPAIASAQSIRGALDDGWGPKIRATPFVGWSPSFESSGNLAVYTGGNNPRIELTDYTFRYGAGPVSGLHVEVRAHDRFSGIGELAWSSRGKTTFEDEDGFQFEEPGSAFWILKLGGLMRLREDSDMQLRRLNGALFLAPAFIREVPEVSILSTSSFTKARNQWGLNFGTEAEMPLANKKLAFHVALEDLVIFWDELSIQQRMQNDITNNYGPEAVAEVAPDRSHMISLRLGLSLRFDRVPLPF